VIAHLRHRRFAYHLFGLGSGTIPFTGSRLRELIAGKGPRNVESRASRTDRLVMLLAQQIHGWEPFERGHVTLRTLTDEPELNCGAHGNASTNKLYYPILIGPS